MNKTALLVVGILLVLGGAFVVMMYWPSTETTVTPSFDPLNTTYTVDGASVALVNGSATSSAVFGQAVRGDLNADGREDAALFLTRDTGGSGSFSYVVAAINTVGKTTGTNAVLLGDRVTLKSIAIKDGVITVKYLDRLPTDPMTTAPSVSATLTLTVSGTTLQSTAPIAVERSYLVSSADPLTYCDGAAMDTEAFRKTITVKNMLTLTDANPTTVDVIKATIAAATTGKCHDVLAQVTITEKDGVVTISPIDGWAGVSITMCSCKPLVEVNILQIPGMKSVIWQ
jgi:hypothetical protein